MEAPWLVQWLSQEKRPRGWGEREAMLWDPMPRGAQGGHRQGPGLLATSPWRRVTCAGLRAPFSERHHRLASLSMISCATLGMPRGLPGGQQRQCGL